MTTHLRWVLREGTNTEQPILQYQNWGEWPKPAGPWVTVPFVVLSREEFDAAKRQARKE